jgi:hypothetical protein
LVEQARMLVQGEEARFVATQSRATTLLAVGGVLAGIGATIAFRFADRDFPWSWHPLGLTVSLAAVIAIVLTIVAVGSLIYASVIALGVMRQEIELETPPFLTNLLIATQFPDMVDDSEDQTARTVIGLLAELHSGALEANEAVNAALRRCGIWMGIAVATGLTAGVFALAASSPIHHGTTPPPSKPQRETVSASGKSSEPLAEPR